MINLAPLTAKDVSPFYEWINDPVAIHYSLSIFQNLSSQHDIDQWFSELLSAKKNYTVGIFLSETNALIGYAGICNISQTNKSGEYFIFIGNRHQWGKGIGTSVTQQIVTHGFDQLKLNRIMLTVSEPNKNAIRAYEKAGFTYEGRLRQACYRNGEFHDKIVLSKLNQSY